MKILVVCSLRIVKFSNDILDFRLLSAASLIEVEEDNVYPFVVSYFMII